MLYLGPYEALIVVCALLLMTFGPPLAGLVLAWVRRKRRGKAKDGPPPA
ncbi:MAG: hypothetical protein KDD82_07725 [Planctomycetes bacterium]|nr:hypothetical protein [Planctomycetota bacterium]